ncbi:MAG: hypothetical protein Q9174_000154 [Haloplaca sp. 1 TL-2023]
MTCDLVSNLIGLELAPTSYSIDRPCTRCVKRNIGHLCHDEPREPAKLGTVSLNSGVEGDAAALQPDELVGNRLLPSLDKIQTGDQVLHDTALDPTTPALPTNGHTSATQLVEPTPASGAPDEPSGGKARSTFAFQAYTDWGLGSLQDMHNFHPSYMFTTPEVTSEYNLFNDFLSTSLLNDGAMFPGEDAPGSYTDPYSNNPVAAGTNGCGGHHQSSLASRLPNPPHTPAASHGGKTRRPSVMPTDKARETYYMTAADPAGSDTPEERMDKLLEAKYEAGMLKPFNYVNGYARLNGYMDKHMRSKNRQKIQQKINGFRPKFRERVQTLTDYELVRVEMWFERSLMEYDRVFASMAIPACCWRRTGEICRGNKEMAQLIHVPIEQLRDVSGQNERRKN